MAGNFKSLLAQLRSDREVIPWAERRELAAALADALGDSRTANAALALVHLLAADPKPEVRKEIADLLVHVPEEDFKKLAASLSEDTSSFVQKAVERALDRRRKGVKESQRRRRDIDHVAEQLELIEKRDGKSGVARARRLADKQFDIMVGSTVHDIRGILSPLKTCISTLQAHIESGQPDRKVCRENLDKMDERIAFLEHFIDDMRAYSQATPTERRRERISDVVKEAVGLVRDELASKGYDLNAVSMEVNVPEGITAEISRHQVVVAIRHVLKNAYEAFVVVPWRRRSRRISIDASMRGAEDVEIVIRDNGPGIAADDLRDIQDFKPGTTTKKNQGGTGLGLPTAHRYATAHGGSLTIDSQEGQGAVVTITLPTEEEDDRKW